MSIFLLTFLLSFVFTWLISAHAEKLRLVVAPNDRSSHHQATPQGGGIAMVSALLITSLPHASAEWCVIQALGLCLALIGLLDDWLDLSATSRLITQFAMVGMFVITHIGFPWWAGLLIFIGVWWINVFNFMDGIDGLAGGEALFLFSSVMLLSYLHNPSLVLLPEWSQWGLLIVAISGFLLMNWPPAKIFMGDVGSTWLGFMIFVFAVWSVTAGWISISAWIILGGIFVADTTVTLLQRMKRGEKITQAHRSHAYQHVALKCGHLNTTSVIVCINLCWLLPLAACAFYVPQWGAVLVVIAYVPLIIGAYQLGAGKC